ncbi:DMT family transporter [Alteromonas sp. C1M14]|uniref:DMT family transporter n=1 Tax=Alteromonas sp. C1M14 TaxID=2841567 RepID=UPI001C082994|nr:DMT family transporter [Alteromonas sp. C1M14]MBU2976798.1 DMT family transporter [Alteromonas sp. C1M14]
MAISTTLYIVFAMIAFAANSLLCRMALAEGLIDPTSFTFIRLASGAFTLSILLLVRKKNVLSAGSWSGAIALFIYAAGFSYAYVSMSTGTGALLLFGAVQLTMLLWGFYKGETFTLVQCSGFIVALGGLVILLLPGLSSPPLLAASIMILAGIGWGAYSIMGKGVSSPLAMTGGNFVKATPIAAILFLLMVDDTQIGVNGALLALASGAMASGLGYALWYHVLPLLKSTNAATIQLSVPVIATVMGWLFLGEQISTRILLASVAILGGIVLVLRKKRAV